LLNGLDGFMQPFISGYYLSVGFTGWQSTTARPTTASVAQVTSTRPSPVPDTHAALQPLLNGKTTRHRLLTGAPESEAAEVIWALTVRDGVLFRYLRKLPDAQREEIVAEGGCDAQVRADDLKHRTLNVD
jgi:hypothetical protein